MKGRIAVVTDFVSTDFFYPIWLKYYGALFGHENLFVIRYRNSSKINDTSNLGGCISIPHDYEDRLRSRFISQTVNMLLQAYDWVVRVDVDEFLVVDPRIGTPLPELITSLKVPYVTAVGLDVIQHTDESKIDLSRAIGHQRRYAYPNSSLYKTCVVSTETHWLEGFHWCNHHPRLAGLIILHMKRVDIEQQMAWALTMQATTPDNAFVKSYYNESSDIIRSYHQDVSKRPIHASLDAINRSEFNNKFMSSIAPRSDKATGRVFYAGQHFHDEILIQIPAELYSGI